MFIWTFSKLSGYHGTIKVINLAPELTTKINSRLDEIMGLNNNAREKFLENLGFNFLLIFNWIDVKNSMNIDDFIKTTIESRETEIIKDFKTQSDLLKKVKQTENIEKLNVSAEQENFLQIFNIISETTKGKIQWHDRVVEKAFENLRKKEDKKDDF